MNSSDHIQTLIQIIQQWKSLFICVKKPCRKIRRNLWNILVIVRLIIDICS